MFSRAEIEGYIDRFKSLHKLSERELQLIEGLQESELEILSRPVQLNMFTKITKTYLRSNGEPLTRFKLYEEFIKRFTIREGEKPARALTRGDEDYVLGYDDPRSKFMQNLAWWISTAHRENRFLPSEIPLDILPRELTKGTSKDNALREALVGSIAEHTSSNRNSSVVERKGANYFYFPHKSYIEFLVSQYFCRVPFSKDMYRTFFNFANPEMISFVSEGPNVGAQNIVAGLQHVAGHVPKQLIKIGSKSSVLRAHARDVDKSKLAVPNIYLYYELFSELEDHSEVENLLLTSINNARIEKKISNVLRLCRDYLLRYGSARFAEKLIVNSLVTLPHFKLKEINRGEVSASHFDGTYISRVILERCVQKHKSLTWRFSPGALKETDPDYRPIGMRCEEYGQVRGTRGERSLLEVDNYQIWNDLKKRNKDAFAVVDAKKYLGIN